MLFEGFCEQMDVSAAGAARLVLALSGGVDSRVLLDLLARYQRRHPLTECRAVHVHHGLSQNADDWQADCARWCDESGIPFYAERVTLDTRGESIEQAARQARYQALEKHITPGSILLTAQHAGDQVETFLLALKRGSGPKGLSAMAEKMPFGEGQIIRPLLQVSRDQIEQYARQHNLSWVTDESNHDTRYDRNYLRHQVIPHLESRWPHISSAVARSAALCAEQEALLGELLADKLQSCVAADGSLVIAGLTGQSEAVRNQLIRLWLERSGARMPSRAQLAVCWQEVAMAQADANPRLKIADGEVRRFQQRLHFIPPLADVSAWQQTLQLNTPVVLPDGLGVLELRSEISGEGLMLRTPLAGEAVRVQFEPKGLSATPLERGHSRKLKKLFQEYGVPSWQRRRLPVIMYGDEVAAVADLFVSKAYYAGECELTWTR